MRIVQSVATICVAAVAVSVVQPAKADVIYSNFGTGNTYSTNARSIGFSGSFSVGALFTPTQSYSVTQIALPLTSLGGPNAFSVSLWTVSNFAPATQVWANPSTVSAPSGIVTITGFSGVTLLANTQYALLVSPGASGAQGGWYGNNIGISSVLNIISDQNLSWFPAQGQQAFSIQGTKLSVAAPEPASMALLMTGAVPLLLRRRDKASRRA